MEISFILKIGKVVRMNSKETEMEII